MGGGVREGGRGGGGGGEGREVGGWVGGGGVVVRGGRGEGREGWKEGGVRVWDEFCVANFSQNLQDDQRAELATYVQTRQGHTPRSCDLQCDHVTATFLGRG